MEISDLPRVIGDLLRGKRKIMDVQLGDAAGVAPTISKEKQIPVKKVTVVDALDKLEKRSGGNSGT